ncbi:MAG: CcdB family protein [Gammaproteobacteria bacterium]|nr:CcdB family protein [Gammaproteobacteria bacterium]
MTQFVIHQYKNSKSTVQYLLDIQNDFLEDLDTRLVIPVYPATVSLGKRLTKLTPVIDINGVQYVLMIPELASVPKKYLGSEILNISQHRTLVLSAIDLMVTGF